MDLILDHVHPLSIQQELHSQELNIEMEAEEENNEKPENSADANLEKINIELSSHIVYQII